ncbi:MAG: hypothetical protein U0520_00170 [Candidatus Saccharimonadales bacterium]
MKEEYKIVSLGISPYHFWQQKWSKTANQNSPRRCYEQSVPLGLLRNSLSLFAQTSSQRRELLTALHSVGSMVGWAAAAQESLAVLGILISDLLAHRSFSEGGFSIYLYFGAWNLRLHP